VAVTGSKLVFMYKYEGIDGGGGNHGGSGGTKWMQSFDFVVP
jgi:hypothetical protein